MIGIYLVLSTQGKKRKEELFTRLSLTKTSSAKIIQIIRSMYRKFWIGRFKTSRWKMINWMRKGWQRKWTTI